MKVLARENSRANDRPKNQDIKPHLLQSFMTSHKTLEKINYQHPNSNILNLTTTSLSLQLKLTLTKEIINLPYTQNFNNLFERSVYEDSIFAP